MIYDCTPPPVAHHRPAIVRALAHVAHAFHIHHAPRLQLCGVPDLETITVTAPEPVPPAFEDEPNTLHTRGGSYGSAPYMPLPPTGAPAPRAAPEVTAQAAPLTFLLFMLLALRGRRRITCE